MGRSTQFFSCSNSLFNSNYSSSSDSIASLCSQALFLNDGPKVKPRTRAFVLNPKCEILGSNGSNPSSSSSSSSALESLKTSAADRYTKESSYLVVIGINFHTTPLEVREKLFIPEAQWPQAISELCELNHIDQAAVLSTCNRMEVYVVAFSKHRGVKEVTDWMSKISGVPISELHQHRVLLYNKDVTRHLFEVSAGLDSLILGEGQIQGQVKQVVNTGKGVSGFGKIINKLFDDAITAGKRVRTETSIATGSVSASSAAVELAQLKLPECSYATARVLVVGAGKMGKLVIKHLAAKGCRKMVVVNRSEDKVAAIGSKLKNVEISYRPLSEMLACVAEADVVFTCTASDTPLFLKEHVQALPPIANGGTRLFIDISVPRNVGSCVYDLDNTRVYETDHLKEVVANNKEDRLEKAMEAQPIIEEQVVIFESWMDSQETTPTIKKLLAYAERIRDSEVEKCLSKMGDLPESKQQVIHKLGKGIMSRLLHGPLKHLRCGGRDNRTLMETLENMHALNRMFDLDKEASILEEKIRIKLEKDHK